MVKSRTSKFGLIAILSTVVILILIVGLAVFSLMLKPDVPEPVEVLKNPTFAVDPGDIDPALAIALLGGLSTQDVVNQAVSKARPGTALATIIYSPDVNTKEAAGDLLLMGAKFAQRQDTARAGISYQLAGTLATLSPDLSDSVRADIFLQVGNGLIAQDDPVLAKIYLDQAFLVATESNYLQAAYRRAVLEKIHQAYLAVGLNTQARQSLEAGLNPPGLSAMPEAPLVLPIGKQIPLPIEVQQAESARWQAAHRVVKELVELGGQVTPVAQTALRDALVREDTVKNRFYTDALASEAQLSARVDLLQAKINWQSIKYRLARRGFGMSLIPEWEEQAEQFRSDLTVSYEDLYRLYNDMIVAMPDASQIDRATEESLRRQVLAGQVGHYPNYPAGQLKTQLLNATARLIETQPGTELRVSYLSVNGVDYYTLISDKEILQP